MRLHERGMWSMLISHLVAVPDVYRADCASETIRRNPYRRLDRYKDVAS